MQHRIRRDRKPAINVSLLMLTVNIQAKGMARSAVTSQDSRPRHTTLTHGSGDVRADHVLALDAMHI